MHYETKLTNNEIQRYSRQIVLGNVRPRGQESVRNAKVIVVGLGGLGVPVMIYLAGSGIGKLGIVDYDIIEMHNLQRQVIYSEKSIGKKKANEAKLFLKSLNSEIIIQEYDDFLDGDNIERIIKDYEIVLDCSDNIKTRYLLNDYCVLKKKKFIAASALKWEGQLFVFGAGSPCYRCLFPEMKQICQSCDEAGIISPVCGILGSLQATETIKMIIGVSTPKFMTYNALTNEFATFDLEKKNKCYVCENKKYVDAKIYDMPPPKIERIDLKYKITWEEYFKNQKNYCLVDIRDDVLYEMCHIKGSINIPAGKIKADINVLNNIDKKICILCAKGISAIKMAKYLIEKKVDCVIIDGGLRKFKSTIDKSFPL